MRDTRLRRGGGGGPEIFFTKMLADNYRKSHQVPIYCIGGEKLKEPPEAQHINEKNNRGERKLKDKEKKKREGKRGEKKVRVNGPDKTYYEASSKSTLYPKYLLTL